MAKKSFKFPVVFVAAGGVGDDTVIGKGSGNAPVDPLGAAPCSYQYWVDNYFVVDPDLDFNGDGPDYDDFGYWWAANILDDDGNPDITSWNDFNPSIPWNED